MWKIFLHSLEAEQGWFKHLARVKIGEWPSHDYDKEFQNVEAMTKYAEEVEAECRAYLKKLKPPSLDKLFPITWHEKSFRVEGILMHVVEECLHHRGEIMCLMWQLDAEPPYTNYPGYLLKTGKLGLKRKVEKARRTKSRKYNPAPKWSQTPIVLDICEAAKKEPASLEGTVLDPIRKAARCHPNLVEREFP